MNIDAICRNGEIAIGFELWIGEEFGATESMPHIHLNVPQPNFNPSATL